MTSTLLQQKAKSVEEITLNDISLEMLIMTFKMDFLLYYISVDNIEVVYH